MHNFTVYEWVDEKNSNKRWEETVVIISDNLIV